MLIFKSYELFSLLCQLTYNLDHVLMLSVLPFPFPYYLPEHADISKWTLHFPFCLLYNPVITTHIPFPRVRLFSRSPCSPRLPWHYFSSQSYTHNPNPGTLFSELLSKLFFFLSDGSFHPYALGGTEESEKENRIEEWASKLKKNHWGGWETVVQR